MKTARGGNTKLDYSSMIFIIVIILVLCLIWGSGGLLKNNNKVYSKVNKVKRDQVIEEFKDTPKFSVKTRNKDKTFDHKDMLIEQADLQYYKTMPSDPKTSFVFREQNINIPYRVNASIDNGIIADINNYDLDNNIYDQIFEPQRNAAGELIEIFEEDHINANRNLQVTLHDADSQNIHDTEINKTVRKIYSTIDIKQNTNSEKLIKDILEYANDREKSSNDIKKIKLVLDKVLDRNAKITNVGGNTEMELLESIWRESSAKSEPTRSNIRDMLLVQISDTYDNHTRSVLCPTGFVNRISVALITETPELFPKTKELLNEEILESASFIRSELEEDNDYKRLSEDGQHEIFKKKLYNKLSIDYKGMLNIDEIKELVAPWIDHL
jgi:hypothetical protein